MSERCLKMSEDDVSAGDLVSTTSRVDIDLTKNTAYRKLVAEELEHFSHIKVTDDLREGGIHAHKSWTFYYEYLTTHLFGQGFSDEVVAQAEQFEHPRLLSLGCGYGGHDLDIARKIRRPFQLVAVDLNPGIYVEAQRRATSEGLNVQFRSLDLNYVDIRAGSFDVIYAHASIHHVLNLEHFFSKLHSGLTARGRLVILDIVGKTQVLFWKENVEFAATLIKRMPRRYRPAVGKRLWRHVWFDPYRILTRYAEPAEQGGMEGIRQEEIESVMSKWFRPIKLARYNAYMRLICTNPYLGARLDPDQDRDREYLEELIRLELQQIESRKLRPTEVFGVFERTA
jgi:SAM-dependent methyltransferase